MRRYISHFHLESGPLFRCCVYKISKDKCVLLFVIHHIIIDGWSINIILHDLEQIYNALIVEQNINLSELKYDFFAFAKWQNKLLSGDKANDSLAFWKDKLQGIPELMSLPTDFSRPAISSNSGATIAFEFDIELSNAIRSLCKSKQCTPYVFLLSIFNILLYKYSCNSDIVVGT